MQPRHILFVTGEYPPMPGGVGAYTSIIAAELLAQGVKTSVLTSTAARPQIAENGSTEKGVQVYATIPRWDWSSVNIAGRLADRIGADWIHVQYQAGAYQLRGAINFAPIRWRQMNWARGLRVAWTYHDLLPPYLFPKAGSRLRRWVTELPARISDLTLVTNEGDRAQIAHKARNLALAPIGSNIPYPPLSAAERDALRDARRAMRGFGKNDLVIGYFGFMSRGKGGLTLIQTLDQLRHSENPRAANARLLLIGERVGASDPTTLAYLAEVEALIDTLDLADRIVWTGRESESEVSADLAICDALVMLYDDGLSLRRGTLMAGLEHGCAIVTTTPAAPLPELEDGRDLLCVPPGDAAAAVRAVLRIVEDPSLAQTLAANARKQSALFSWSRIAHQHIQYYTEAARG